MKLFLVGLDHTSAPVAVRECLAFKPDDIQAALLSLTSPDDTGSLPLLTEAVILSTCNRVEVYGVTHDDVGEAEIVAFLARFHNVPVNHFAPSLFFRAGDDVVVHLFETTAGLRSIVLGEAQIQGQVRKAFALAQRTGTVGATLSRLFSRAITTGKRVRNETHLAHGAASASQAAIALAEQRLGTLEGSSVLLMGSGKMSELAAQNLLANGSSDLAVINRTYDNAAELAARYGARAYRYEELVTALANADIVISSTAAPGAIICREHIAAALQQRSANDRPASMLLIDIAVPRDIEPAVGDLPGIHLCTVDDLHEVINTTLASRNTAVGAARAIVAEELATFDKWLHLQQAMPVLAEWRQQAEELRNTELERALKQLGDLSPEQQHVVEALSRSLVNKLLHNPTLHTRTAAADGEGQRCTAMLRELWSF